MSAYWPTAELQLLILRIAGVGQELKFRMLKFLLWASHLTGGSAEEYVLWLGQRATD
jgi:hypothetical protein